VHEVCRAPSSVTLRARTRLWRGSRHARCRRGVFRATLAVPDMHRTPARSRDDLCRLVVEPAGKRFGSDRTECMRVCAEAPERAFPRCKTTKGMARGRMAHPRCTPLHATSSTSSRPGHGSPGYPGHAGPASARAPPPITLATVGRCQGEAQEPPHALMRELRSLSRTRLFARRRSRFASLWGIKLSAPAAW